MLTNFSHTPNKCWLKCFSLDYFSQGIKTSKHLSHEKLQKSKPSRGLKKVKSQRSTFVFQSNVYVAKRATEAYQIPSRHPEHRPKKRVNKPVLHLGPKLGDANMQICPTT
jgi:hypothetical protein